MVRLPTRDVVSASLALPSLRRAMSKEELNSKSILSEYEEDSFESESLDRSNSNFTSKQNISEDTENRIGHVEGIKNRPPHPSIRKLDTINEFANESNSKILSPSQIFISNVNLKQKSEVVQTEAKS